MTPFHTNPQSTRRIATPRATRRLYVGNLPYDTTAESLRAVFEKHGDVTDVHVLVDRYSGRPRGFAFVTMASREQAMRAVAEMNGALFDGRPLRVYDADARRATSGPDARR